MGPGRRNTSERGSVMMLVPAGVLILFLLASMAVDSAIAFMAQRELSALAAASANDAAGAGLSDDAFYLGGGTPGQIVLDQRAAEELAGAALANRAPRGVTDVQQRVTVSLDQVCVTVTGRVEYIFAKAIPGLPRGRSVTGQAVATAAQGDAGAVVQGRRAGICPG